MRTELCPHFSRLGLSLKCGDGVTEEERIEILLKQGAIEQLKETGLIKVVQTRP